MWNLCLYWAAVLISSSSLRTGPWMVEGEPSASRGSVTLLQCPECVIMENTRGYRSELLCDRSMRSDRARVDR